MLVLVLVGFACDCDHRDLHVLTHSCPTRRSSDLVAPLPDDPRVIRFSALTDNDGRPDPVAIDAQRDIRLIQYTGGTPGTPNGHKLTHQKLTANTQQVNSYDPTHAAEQKGRGIG